MWRPWRDGRWRGRRSWRGKRPRPGLQTHRSHACFLNCHYVLRVKERVKKMSVQMKHDEERRKSLQVTARTSAMTQQPTGVNRRRDSASVARCFPTFSLGSRCLEGDDLPVLLLAVSGIGSLDDVAVKGPPQYSHWGVA